MFDYPYNMLMAGTVFVFIYTLGYFERIPQHEYLKTAGIAGVGVVLLMLFNQNCASTASFLALILLGCAVAIHIVVWAFYFISDNFFEHSEKITGRDIPVQRYGVGENGYERHIDIHRRVSQTEHSE